MTMEKNARMQCIMDDATSVKRIPYVLFGDCYDVASEKELCRSYFFITFSCIGL